ncbi:MAG: glycosyltransferase family 4 protein [Pseudomonadota bacterium]|nr:glycosyltransferase family 4 protein [Pseudomonadota bacterium]
MRKGVCLIGPGGGSGLQAYAAQVAEELAARDEAAWTLAARGPFALTAPLFFTAAAIRLTWLAMSGRIDSAHLLVAELGSVWRKGLLAALARALGLRVVIHLHGPELAAEARDAWGPTRFALRAGARLAHVNLALGRDLARFLTEDLGAPAERVAILRNALPDAPWSPRRVPARPGRDRPLRVLFVAPMTRCKGARAVVQALAMLRAHGIEAEAVLAGAGPERVHARAEARRLGVAADFPGRITAAEAEDLMEWADVLAHPSSREGLPLTLLQALRAGLPAVAAPSGAIGEALPQGDGLVHIPARDAAGLARALERLANDPAWLLALGEAARVVFENRFRMDRHVDRLEAHYGWTAPQPRGIEAPAQPA